jgi:hypothetical protein
MVMEQIPDHPVIQSMERTGHPPGRMRPMPPFRKGRCPSAHTGAEGSGSNPPEAHYSGVILSKRSASKDLSTSLRSAQDDSDERCRLRDGWNSNPPPASREPPFRKGAK